LENEVFSIRREDYLAHIDGKIEMYDLLLTALCEARSLLLAGKPYELLRALNDFEHQAHDLFSSWNIPDEYLENGQFDALLYDDLMAPLGQRPGDGDAQAYSEKHIEKPNAVKHDAGANISTSHAILMAGQLTECASAIIDVCEALTNAVENS